MSRASLRASERCGSATRLVVVSPHPDDEVLTAGGLMQRAAIRDHVVVVAVTDGESSHARSSHITPDALRAVRAAERAEALDRLGVPATVLRLAQPDQGCHARVVEIAAALRQILAHGDLVVGPSSADGHPDHVAVAAALRLAAAGVVDTLWEAPTWALVHGTAPVPSCTLRLHGRAWAVKRHAVAAFRSQLEALGPDPVDGPVIHPAELAAMLRPREEFLAVEV